MMSTEPLSDERIEEIAAFLVRIARDNDRLNVAERDKLVLAAADLRECRAQGAAQVKESWTHETGWLIELKGDGPPKWFKLSDEGGDDYWTQDSLAALRFGRKIDAERYIEDIGWTEAFATEHEWTGPALEFPEAR